MSDKPLHIALIPDGNRRWAKDRGMLPWKGHEQSAENFDAIVEWCAADARVGTLTFWAFSTENWKREKVEVEQLMKLFEKYIRKERENLKKNGVALIRSGRTDRMPASLKTLLEDVAADPPAEIKLHLHMAIDYGGKDEVTRAVQKLPDAAGATEEAIRAAMDQPLLPDIDLIIRTSGEQRTSNFFLFQSAYAEWIFLEKHFPDFTSADIETAIGTLANRKRRFGK
ncbi:MAG TPA: polyprenyl diphosphate synthase [Candidatus Peribacteria bacterium]|nr:polyprenyl diphosphate synthase [Candidatus Peribacteria bacterium]